MTTCMVLEYIMIVKDDIIIVSNLCGLKETLKGSKNTLLLKEFAIHYSEMENTLRM